MSEKKNYLFLLTIGPVQSFIAQARKAQDLYAGSKLLSELAKAGLNKIDYKTLIFPNYLDEVNASVPNRFLCLIESDTPENIGKKIEQEVKEKFQTIAFNVLQQNLEIEVNAQSFEELDYSKEFNKYFKQQIEQHLEVYWVFEEIKDNDYKKAYQNINEQLGAIKNLRRFQQFNEGGGETGRKCSLDGERNALIFGKGTNENYISEKWNPFAIILKNQPNVQLSKNEGLSAVSMTKRFYKSNSKMPSTAEIALLANIKKLDNENKLCFDEYSNSVFKHESFVSICLNRNIKIELSKENKLTTLFDNEFLFEENITDDNFPNPYQKKIALEYVVKLKKYLKTKYYALVTFDGDDMGEWLSGSKLDGYSDLKDFHVTLSGYLTEFAKESQLIVDKKGKSIYAGGDDFLGLVNLNYLEETLGELKKIFNELVNNKLKEKYPLLNESLSFSAGIAIAHYKTPLNEVLNQARRLQDKAKQSFRKKNAIGIAYLTRSSIIGEAYIKNADLKLLYELVKAINEEKISTTFLFKFIQGISPIIGDLPDTDAFSTQVSILNVELRRLMKRATQKEDWAEIETFIYEPLINQILLPDFDREGLKTSVENFTSFVKIAEKIASNVK